MTGHGAKFGRKQEEAIAALLSNRTIEEAARACNVAYKTLRRWLDNPEFQKRYREARHHAVQQALARLQQSTGAASIVILKLMTSERPRGRQAESSRERHRSRHQGRGIGRHRSSRHGVGTACGACEDAAPVMRARAQKRKLDGRLTDLEGFFSAAVNALSEKERSDDAIAAVRAILAELGVEQEGDESLAEAFARTLGMTPREVHDELMKRAMGARSSVPGRDQ